MSDFDLDNILHHRNYAKKSCEALKYGRLDYNIGGWRDKNDKE